MIIIFRRGTITKTIRKALNSLSGYFQKENRNIPWILLQGEPKSGKTTCLYYLLSVNRDRKYPETQLNMIDVAYGNYWFKLIDLGKELEQDPEIVQFFTNMVDGVVYIISGKSEQAIIDSIEPFNEAMGSIPKNIPVLVIINKWDPKVQINLGKAMELFDLINISSPDDPRSFHFEICNFNAGDGVYRAFDWLVSKLTAFQGFHEEVSIRRILIYDRNGLLQFDMPITPTTNEEEDGVLLSGLLSALNHMARRVFADTSYLDVVTIGDYSMVLVPRGDQICCILMDRGGPISKAKQIGRKTLDIFNEEGTKGRIAIEQLVEESKDSEF
ncbi:MAG: hypothetical protein GF308_03780 [Candidatus Heimdallarchaeota archaeon]|nr:hypothetical protein [Candidatus Heimdallarchaeota archaeon]